MFQAGAPRAKDFFLPVFLQIGDCVFVHILKVYIERTKASHPTNSGAKNPLFLSYIKPHGPVTSTTLARWVKSTLAQAGIDTTKFKAHSSRSASSSAAYEARVALPDIMEAADWSTVFTFAKFYHRTVCKSSFANAVLGQTGQSSLAVSSEEQGGIGLSI